jgi:hypothetical protein|tara:strand:- start:876 stop:1358 length:483 start_codon:yes stop_codon:yes gene_type:complete
MKNLNEKNEEHESSTYTVPPQFHSSLGEKISGNNITTKISRLSKKENLTDEEEKTLKWLKGKNNAEVNKIDAQKRIIMRTDGVGKKKGGNAFIDTHEKDKDNANPTKVGGLADMKVRGKHSKVSDQIENNRVQYYESYNKEIKDMKYLIEYMCNKNNKTI